MIQKITNNAVIFQQTDQAQSAISMQAGALELAVLVSISGLSARALRSLSQLA